MRLNTQIGKYLKESTLDFIFPRHCLSCEEKIKEGSALLCELCSTNLDLIDPYYRCKKCFSALEADYGCTSCKQYSFAGPVAAAFDYQEPINSIIQGLKYQQLPSLAKALAGFMALQIDRLNWPLPDFIIPVPTSLDRLMMRGYNPAGLLAQQLSRILTIPIKNVLGRKMFSKSQSMLNLDQRKNMNPLEYFLRKPMKLHGKKVLLVDDVITSGSTLKACSNALLPLYPDTIYHIAVART